MTKNSFYHLSDSISKKPATKESGLLFEPTRELNLKDFEVEILKEYYQKKVKEWQRSRQISAGFDDPFFKEINAQNLGFVWGFQSALSVLGIKTEDFSN